MSSLSSVKIAQILRKKNISILKIVDFQRIFHLTNRNTSYKILQRLVSYRILERITPGMYMVSGSSLNDFVFANSLYTPSYISLESALAYYGILEQFPFVVTSITLNKSKTIKYHKTFEYSHIDKKNYFGFMKDKEFLIATPEKALVDTIYLMSKGLRNIDLGGINKTNLNRKTFLFYSRQISSPQYRRFIKEHQLI
ncbi:MAG: hypothetical protein AAB874_05050 [Patescibacteria group bacterium]